MYNDIFLKIQLKGYGATHYRATVGNIEEAEWNILNEDYIIKVTLPNQEGDYNLSYQLKNPYNVSQIITVPVRYQEVIDLIPPSIPQNVTVSNLLDTSLTLNWDVSTDDVEVDRYDIYVNNIFFISSITNELNITGLTQNTNYSFKVNASDAQNNTSDFSEVKTITTAPTAVSTLVGNVVISQIFSPSSTIVNVQDGTSVDHCFVTLYNKSEFNLSLNNAKLYWKYDAYPEWQMVNLSGTIEAGKYFLIRGSKLTGVVAGTTILVDWNIAVPDLDCSVVWADFIDPTPEDTAGAQARMEQWAIDNNLLYIGSKSGSVYLTDKEYIGTLPINPWESKDTLIDYVDEVGLLGTDYTNTAYENSPISGSKKSLIWNRTNAIDSDNNSADFTSVSVMLGTSAEVSALIKSSRT